MNVLTAIIAAGVGLYTIYSGPRSWPHWLAGCAAFTLSFATSMATDEHSHQRILWACTAYFATLTHIIINVRADSTVSSSGILRDIVMLALGTAAGSALLLTTLFALSIVPLTLWAAWLIVSSILNVEWAPPSGWRVLHFFNFGAFWSFFVIPVPLTAFLLLAFPLLGAYFIMVEMKTETVLRRLAVACNAVALLLLIANYAALSSTAVIYDATRFGTPALLSIGVLLTCISMIRLVPCQPDSPSETIESST